MRILAIDGALNHSGWALLDTTDGEGWDSAKASKYGIITTKATMSLAFKLFFIRQELIKIIKSYKPDVIVFEDTYAGQNALTTARLNNAKGIILMTAYEALNKEPVCVKATVARACLGFKNGKDPKKEPWEFFKKRYNLQNITFERGNDVTDAYVLGWYYILSQTGDCAAKKKPKRKSRKKVYDN
jgi:Holliday junction resolvasome RuvABC endonuclease subunit